MCLTVEVGVQLMDSWKDISIKHTIEEKREGGEGKEGVRPIPEVVQYR